MGRWRVLISYPFTFLGSCVVGVVRRFPTRCSRSVKAQEGRWSGDRRPFLLDTRGYTLWGP